VVVEISLEWEVEEEIKEEVETEEVDEVVAVEFSEHISIRTLLALAKEGGRH